MESNVMKYDVTALTYRWALRLGREPWDMKLPLSKRGLLMIGEVD